MSKQNRYSALIEDIFFERYKPGDTEIVFHRDNIPEAAKKLGLDLPKNLGDLIYTFRYRDELPQRIVQTAPRGKEWQIHSRGKSLYTFVLAKKVNIVPNPHYAEIKILDATPGIIQRYAQTDEQALLAKLRYNRIIDIFTGITCYSLQNHLRTTVRGIGQIETDEIYIGVDRTGTHYIIPVQAKGKNDRLGIMQIEQDHAMCAQKFPSLKCIPIAAQFIEPELIALFSFDMKENKMAILSEKHYRLVANDELSDEELREYMARSQMLND